MLVQLLLYQWHIRFRTLRTSSNYTAVRQHKHQCAVRLCIAVAWPMMCIAHCGMYTHPLLHLQVALQEAKYCGWVEDLGRLLDDYYKVNSTKSHDACT